MENRGVEVRLNENPSLPQRYVKGLGESFPSPPYAFGFHIFFEVHTKTKPNRHKSKTISSPIAIVLTRNALVSKKKTLYPPN